MKHIYLDNAATTMLDPVVIKAMIPYLTSEYGNPGSSHELGKQARKAVERARSIIAKSIKASEDEIIFTGSATESDNLAIKGVAYANKSKGRHIITSKIEHKAVLETCNALEREGFAVTYLDVTKEGIVEPITVKKSLRKETILVSIGHANNEIGTVQDITTIGKICKNAGVYFHTDAAQSFTKVPIDVKTMNLDLVTVSAHKIHGPKGIGALYVKNGLALKPLIHGGNQEKGLRSGTEDVGSIVGFGVASYCTSKTDIVKMTQLRDYFIKELISIKGIKVHGSLKQRLCNNIHVSFQGLDADSILEHLNSKGIYASAGSACTTGTIIASHVLRAIGMDDKAAHSSIRFSLSKFTTKEEIDYTIKQVKEIVRSLTKVNAILNKV